jgi:hypothetical protein
VLLLLLCGLSPDTLIPLLLLLLLRVAGANALRSGAVPAAALPPPNAPSWFHRPTSDIGLLVLVIEGIPLRGRATFITPGNRTSAAAAALLPSLLLLLLLPLLLLGSCGAIKGAPLQLQTDQSCAT